MFDPSRFADSLALGTDGIWYCPNREVSYPVDGNQACFQIEESSFWFNHRNACIAAAVQQFPPHENGPIFDIGGGNGFVSLGLMRAGFESILVEPGPSGASNGKARGVPTVICATTSGAGFKRSSLPAIGLFDVIEHIDNDLDFLKSMRKLLQPSGRLYATVPAYSALWSLEDQEPVRNFVCGA
jgi:SAM-dependent methyltransferase